MDRHVFRTGNFPFLTKRWVITKQSELKNLKCFCQVVAMAVKLTVSMKPSKINMNQEDIYTGNKTSTGYTFVNLFLWRSSGMHFS